MLKNCTITRALAPPHRRTIFATFTRNSWHVTLHTRETAPQVIGGTAYTWHTTMRLVPPTEDAAIVRHLLTRTAYDGIRTLASDVDTEIAEYYADASLDLQREAIQAAYEDGKERDKYNGWKNRETWLVALWFDNDQDHYNHIRQTLIPHALDVNKEQPLNALARKLEKYAQDITPAFAGLFCDLIGQALSRVDWPAIANHYAPDIAEIAEDL